MKLDKKQIPQLVILGLLTLLCIGYVSFTLTRGSKPAQQVQAAQPSAKNNESATAGCEQDTNIEVAKSSSTGLEPLMRRDPFIPQRLPGAEMNDPTSVPAPQKSGSVRPSVQVVRNPLASVPPINPFRGVSPVATPLPVATATEPAKPVQQEQDPQFVLTGVIRGEQNVAIVRSGESGRHIVREGQLIDGRYRVISISDDSAVLVHENHRIYLKLGGAKNAS